jgi:Uma2 family endonuclease
MLEVLAPPRPELIVYPESDGKPLAENTKQLRWIVVLFGNLSALFHAVVDVFVGADLLWYPEEGQPDVRLAPDVFVVFGRPKGDRSSYRQWEEGVPLTVVFEVLSPGNTVMEMDDKQDFFERHGVEEYYLYDPDSNRLKAFIRRGEVLRRVRPVQNFVSPRLGIRFDLSGPEMVVFGPDGQRFLTFEEVTAERDKARQQLTEARQLTDKAEQRATTAEQRAARLAELTRKALGQQLTLEERQELERLLEQPPTPAS